MTTRRIATILAAVGVLMAFVGSARVAYALAYAPRDQRAIGLLALVPVALGFIALLAVRTASVAFVWVAVGALCGFVVLAGFSLGPFFGWEALALIVAASVHLETVRPRWKLLTAPAWFVAGVFALCPVFLAVLVVRFGEWRDLVPGVSHPTTTVVNREPHQGFYTYGWSSHLPPIVTFGTWMFVAGLAVIAAGYVVAALRGRDGRSPGAKLALAVGALALLVAASGLALEGVRVLQAPTMMHGVRCEPSGSLMKCTNW